MEQLPQNVLLKIFSLLGSEDLIPLKQVAHEWEELIDKEIGVTLHVGQGNPVYWCDGINWSPVQSICEFGASKCYFSEVENPLPASGFKYPHLLRDLSFDGFIQRSSFTLIINQVSNTLRGLALHTSTLCFLKSTQLKNWRFPSLKELHIYCYGCSPEMSWSYMDDCIIDNLTAILQSNFFPKLECLKISTLFIAKREREITFSIIQFLVRHAETLRYLRVEFRYEGMTNDEIVPSSYTEEIAMKLAIKLHKVKLQYFKLHFWFNGSPKFHRTWADLLRRQNSLATIVYVTGRGWSPFPSCIILQNQSTLVRVTIRMDLSCDFFDCSVFRNCHSLKRLCLMNRAQRRASNQNYYEGTRRRKSMWSNTPILMRPTFLPNRIDTLFISWIKIARNDVDLLYDHLTDLKEMSFTFIGERGVFGVSARTAVRFLETKRLKRFTILRGFNRDPRARRASDPFQSFVNMLTGVNRLCLDLVRNKYGSYDPIR